MILLLVGLAVAQVSLTNQNHFNYLETQRPKQYTAFPTIPPDMLSFSLTLDMPSLIERETYLKNQNIQIGGRDVMPMAFSQSFSEKSLFDLANASLGLTNLKIEPISSVFIASVDKESQLRLSSLNISFLSSPCSCFELDGGSIYFDNLVLSSSSLDCIKPVVTTMHQGGIVTVSSSNFESLLIEGSTGLIADSFTSSVSFSYCVLKNITHSQHFHPSPQWSYNHHSSLVNNALEYVDNVFYGGIVQGMLGSSFVCANTTIRGMRRDAIIPQYHASKAQQQLSESKIFDHATIRESTAPNHGGAIWMIGPGELKITESNFIKCNVTDDDSQGGAIDVTDTTNNPELYMSNTVINRCQAVMKGGGYIWNGLGKVETTSCVVCSAENGGGLYLNPISKDVLLNYSSFTHCYASQNGGGCFIEAIFGENGLLTLDNCLLTLCESNEGIGGGVYLSNVQENYPETVEEQSRKQRVLFKECLFKHNSAIKLNKGQDVGAADAWEGLLVKSSFTGATSLTDSNQIAFKTRGDFSDWVEKKSVFSGEFVVIILLVAAVGIALIAAAVIISIACCCWNKKQKKKQRKQMKKEAKKQAMTNVNDWGKQRN
eukprot:MONOS_10133.1-p1 / transcript=MONOS_10133.1 / gene=MONOS_10133 / organism=Monocercomonoides_exilis_PA203 / gene_product=unspecified product / transcript_product=unspecified product / location=Mono_scaffold00447:22138-23940(+) / protein_length=601 / sequence_SO=supercontig / SO=protein_coding / is_pseudo=false